MTNLNWRMATLFCQKLPSQLAPSSPLLLSRLQSRGSFPSITPSTSVQEFDRGSSPLIPRAVSESKDASVRANRKTAATPSSLATRGVALDPRSQSLAPIHFHRRPISSAREPDQPG